MLRRIDLRGRTPGTIEIRGLLPRAPVQVESALASVGPICDDVRARGALAVRELTKRFDGVDLTTLRVPPEVLAAAPADLDDSVRAALVEAASRARLVHEAQLHADVDIEITTLRVPPEVLAAAPADLDDSVRAALVEAASRARLVHEAQLHADVDI